jgi:hypothetical protein
MQARLKETSHTRSSGKAFHVPNRLSWEYPSWSVTLKDEHRLRVTEKKIAKQNIGYFGNGHKRDARITQRGAHYFGEMNRMRKLHNSLLHDIRYNIPANNVVLEDKHKY